MRKIQGIFIRFLRNLTGVFKNENVSIYLHSHKVLAVEVKLSNRIEDIDVKSLHWLKNKIGEDLIDQIVINTGSTAYRRKDGVAVIQAILLGQ